MIDPWTSSIYLSDANKTTILSTPDLTPIWGYELVRATLPTFSRPGRIPENAVGVHNRGPEYRRLQSVQRHTRLRVRN